MWQTGQQILKLKCKWMQNYHLIIIFDLICRQEISLKWKCLNIYENVCHVIIEVLKNYWNEFKQKHEDSSGH